jgi:hypothetical protein
MIVLICLTAETTYLVIRDNQFQCLTDLSGTVSTYTGNITVSMGDNAAGDTVDYTCPGDGVADEIMFAHVTSSNAKYAYVVTDLSGTILGLPPGNMVNFEGAGLGVAELVWFGDNFLIPETVDYRQYGR